MQPGAELCVCDGQGLVLDNVFGYLREGQGHRGEHQDAGDKVQTEETVCGKLFIHEWCRTDILICRIDFKITSLRILVSVLHF